MAEPSNYGDGGASAAPTSPVALECEPRSFMPNEVYHSPTYSDKPLMFGEIIPDGLNIASKHIEVGFMFMTEISALVAARAALERTYSRGLADLSRVYGEKFAARSSVMSLGSSAPPSAQLDIDTMPSYLRVWQKYVHWMGEEAKQRQRMADRMVSTVCDKIQENIKTKDEIRKKHLAAATKLQDDVHKIISDARTDKESYMSDCESLVKSKIKFNKNDLESSLSSPKSKQLVKFCVAKNKYLTSVSAVNTAIDSFHIVNIPWLINEMEALERSRIEDFRYIMRTVNYLEIDLDKNRTIHLTELREAILSIDCAADTMIFAIANRAEKPKKSSISFQSTSLWRDSSEIIKGGVITTTLQNYRNKLKSRISARYEEFSKIRVKIEGMRKLHSVYLSKADLTQYLQSYSMSVDLAHQSSAIHTFIRSMEAEITIIDDCIGSYCGDQHPHTFMRASYKKKRLCPYCQKSLFAMTKSVLVCTKCNEACHILCENKIEANCGRAAKNPTDNGNESVYSFATSNRTGAAGYSGSSMYSQDDDSINNYDDGKGASGDVGDSSMADAPDGGDYHSASYAGGERRNSEFSLVNSTDDLQQGSYDYDADNYNSSHGSASNSNGLDISSSLLNVGFAVADMSPSADAANSNSHLTVPTAVCGYAMVIYDYDPIDDGTGSADQQVCVRQNDVVRVVEWDNATSATSLEALPGWASILNQSSVPGQVPSSYLKDISSVFDPARNFMRMLFDYDDPQGNSEMSLKEGDIIEATSGDEGGWTTVLILGSGSSGVVPTSYVEPLKILGAP